MEKKNMVLLTVIAVATLLVAVVGATFAYFTATSTDTRTDNEDNGRTQLTTASVANTTTVANIDGQAGKFNKTDIYPGHMEVAGLSVAITRTSSETENTYAIPFIYNVTENTIGANVNYYLYRADSKQETAVDTGCKIKVDTTSDSETGKTRYSEECSFKNAEEVGSTSSSHTGLKLVATGPLKGSTETIQMIDDIKLTTEETNKTVYYYFVVEFADTNSDQPDDMGKTLDGTITVAGAKASGD